MSVLAAPAFTIAVIDLVLRYQDRHRAPAEPA
jgi:hypothetical protein